MDDKDTINSFYAEGAINVPDTVYKISKKKAPKYDI